MTDVLLFQTLDDGEVNIQGGQVELTDGLETAVYLSLFGGNEADDGRPDNDQGWWGNAIADDPDERMVSRLQNLMDSVPAVTGNLRRLEDAARVDLAWLPERYEVEVTASLPGINRVRLVVQIDDQVFTFDEPWGQQ